MKQVKIVISLIITSLLIGQQSLDEFLWGDDLYITTASKKLELADKAPATVTVITEKMIRQRGYRDLKDVLNDLPGFDLSTNVYGEFSTLVTQRGIGGNNKIVVLLNGVPVTSPSGKQFQFGNNVPVWNLDKIEIVYGPGSALYGANAFGVINMITKNTDDEGLIDANVMAGAHNTKDIYLNVRKKISDDISFTGFYRSYQTEGANLLNEYEEYSDTSNGFLHGYKDPVADQNIFIQLSLGDYDIQFHHSILKEQLAKGLNPNDHYMYSEDAWWGNSLWQLNARHHYENDALSVDTDISYRQFKITPEMNWSYYSAWNEDNQLLVHQYGIMEQTTFESKFDYDISMNLNVTAGIMMARRMGLPTGDKGGDPFDVNDHLELDNFYNHTDGFDQSALYEKDDAIYFQATYFFSDNLTFLGGARQDRNSVFGNALNPRGGLIYERNNSVFKLLYGSAYIAPGMFHRFETWFATDYGHLQNPDLKPETLQTLEANWIQNFGEKLKTSVSLFQNNAKDLIVRKSYGTIDFADEWYEAGAGWVDANGDSSVFMEWSTNQGSLRSYGTDISLNYVMNSDINLFLGYSFLDGTNTDPESGEDLPLFKTSTHKLMGGVTLSFGNLSLTPRFRWVSDIATRKENELYGVDRDYDWVPESDHEKMPGYSLVNVSVDYEHLPGGLSAYLHIDNVLNNHYYTAGVATEGSHTYLPRVPQNLRHITFGLSWEY